MQVDWNAKDTLDYQESRKGGKVVDSKKVGSDPPFFGVLF